MITVTPGESGEPDPMERMDPLDAVMVLTDQMSQPMHVAAVLILSPPDGAGPEYVDDLYREALAATDPIDPPIPERATTIGPMAAPYSRHGVLLMVPGGSCWGTEG